MHIYTYLYQLSSTGVYELIKSINRTQSLADPNALRGGAVSLELPLSPILANTIYCSIQQNRKSNEVRQFTSWINILHQV